MSKQDFKTRIVHKQAASQVGEKREYKSPVLCGFGTVIDLTAAQIASGLETGNANKKARP